MHGIGIGFLMTCHHSFREMHCMQAHNLKDLKEQGFLVKAIQGILLSPPFRPPNTAPQRSMSQLAPHRGLLPLPVGTAGWGLCRDSSLPTAGKPQCLSQGLAACPGSGRGATGHGEEETALLPTQVQAGKGQKERGRNHRFVLHPWLLHGWSTWKCQTQKRQHSVWHFRHTSLWETLWSASSWSLQSWGLSAIWFVDTGWGTCGTSSLACPWAGWSCLGAMSPSHATFPLLPAPPPKCCGTTLPPDIPDTHPKPDGPFDSPGSDWTSPGRLPQLRSTACGHGQQSLPKTHMWVLDSCWLQFSITVQLVQLPQSTTFLTGKRWFLELETFSCENGSFDKGLSFCDRDNQNEKSRLESKCKEIENWNSYTFCFDISHSKLLRILSSLCENVPFLIFFKFVSLGKKNLEMLTFLARDISGFI